MKVLLGRQQNDIEPEVLAERIRGHFPVHIDIGTGSGRLMLKNAGKNPNGFYIGMDPCAVSMYESSVKAAKHKKKTGLDNLLFVIASIEAAPRGLYGIADIITVIMPWGSLRDGIAKACPPVLDSLRKLGKPGSALEIIVGYDEKAEACEIKKRSLPALSRGHFDALAPAYRKAGIVIDGIGIVGNGELKLIESDWAKKLAYGASRTMYRLDCVCI